VGGFGREQKKQFPQQFVHSVREVIGLTFSILDSSASKLNFDVSCINNYNMAQAAKDKAQEKSKF